MMAGLTVAGVDMLEQRIGGDLGADRLGAELAFRDRADDAEVVARRRQEHRDGAAHDDGVQVALVAVCGR